MSSTRYKNIVVALDTSPRAPGVLAAAVDIARESGAQLTLFRSVGIPIDLPPEALSMSPAKLPEFLEDRARHGLEELARSLPDKLVRGVSVHVGVPWEAICRVAREVEADLIVLGSHGFSGIDHLIGTTASRVVNHADRSVLVVREHVKDRRVVVLST